MDLTKITDGIKLHFHNALYHNFVIAVMPSEQKVISQFYEEATGKQLTGWNCNSCALKNCINAGRLYFTLLKEEKAAETTETVEDTTETTETVEDTTEGKEDKAETKKKAKAKTKRVYNKKSKK